MKVAFFIGHHKTGSTALQTYLAENYLTLLREGILYPAVEAQGSAANLAAAFTGQVNPDDTQRLNVREPHNALAFRMLNEAAKLPVPVWHPNLPSSEQMLHLIAAQIESLHPKQMVICSEVMSGLSDDGWRKTLPQMQRHFSVHECTIVLNLRRPDHHIASLHMHRLKLLQRVKPLRDGGHTAYYDTRHFRFDRVVERWSEAFPNARFHVRNYADVVAAGGSVQDFFAQSGIGHTPVETGKRANVSFPHALAEIMRQAIQQSPETGKRVRAYLLRAMERVTCVPNDQVELFGEANRTALCDAFAPVHTALSQRLGVEAFFPDIELARQCNPVPELQAARQALVELKEDSAKHLKPGPVRAFLSGLKIEG